MNKTPCNQNLGASLNIQLILKELDFEYCSEKERPGFLIPLLRSIQDRLGYVPIEILSQVSQALNLPESHVYSVATFYPSFLLFTKAPDQTPNHTLDERLEAHFDIQHSSSLKVFDPSRKYPGQMRRVLARCGEINPLNIEEAIAQGAYEALKKVITLSPEAVIEEVRQSGIRGTGGAGFPTAQKWKFAREAKSPDAIKYLICNAAEGDLGAFMDRAILENDPHLVIEGMAIAAHAIGATKGYIYLRAEYSKVIPVIETALQQATEQGWIGKGFDIELFHAAGMYVCGEETALINSMEGKPGRPRLRPPFPAQAGLWNRPTVVNNVKTLAHIPLILKNGAAWFSSVGTERSKGTAILTLTGAIARPGVVEVPMGITLKEIIYGVGGGGKNGKKIKAIQTGGPLGGVIPEKLFTTPLSFEAMAAVRSPLGSGGIIVLAEDTCMVSMAAHFTEFAQAESCGHCTPCRLGTTQLLAVMKDLTLGQGEEEDLGLMESMAEAMRWGSFCAFGQSAANVALSALFHFREEFEAHTRQKICPAGQCRFHNGFRDNSQANFLNHSLHAQKGKSK